MTIVVMMQQYNFQANNRKRDRPTTTIIIITMVLNLGASGPTGDDFEGGGITQGTLTQVVLQYCDIILTGIFRTIVWIYSVCSHCRGTFAKVDQISEIFVALPS